MIRGIIVKIWVSISSSKRSPIEVKFECMGRQVVSGDSQYDPALKDYEGKWDVIVLSGHAVLTFS